MIQGQPSLNSEFQATQGSMVRLCLKRKTLDSQKTAADQHFHSHNASLRGTFVTLYVRWCPLQLFSWNGQGSCLLCLYRQLLLLQCFPNSFLGMGLHGDNSVHISFHLMRFTASLQMATGVSSLPVDRLHVVILSQEPEIER